MKNLFTTLFTLYTIGVFAQVGIGTTTPDSSSILEMSSTTQGVLTPRMTQTNRDAIASPATGLLIYQTDNTPGFYYFNGTAWVPFGGVDNDWTISGNDMYNANTGNVAVGNTSPTAKFHITGTASPGGSGGTVELINEDFTSYTVVQNFTPDASCTTTSGWEVNNSAPAGYVCTNCTGNYLYIDADDSGCDQDATLVMSFTPTNTSVDISFDYLLREYSSGADSFRVYLHDGTSQVGADILLIDTASSTTTDSSFTGNVVVTPSTTYSLRFEYTGSFAYGATLDNVLVTETSLGTGGTYVFRLEDGQQQDGYVLTSDADGNATWEPATGGTDNQTLSISGNDLTISNGNTITLPTGGGGTYTFNNGLTLTGSTAQLGGDLIKDTTINIGDNDFVINGNGTSGFTGEMTLNGNNKIIFQTEVDEDYINFGGTAFVDSDDGQSFSDTYSGGPYTKDFVLGAHNGASGGTAIALGSIEYIVDGTNELFYEGSGLSPMSDFGSDLGADPFSGVTRRWDDVYADDFITPTATYPIVQPNGRSASSLKMKGLKEILQLNPVAYIEDVDKIGGTKIPDNLKEEKLGFYADELLRVIPEAVKTSDWVSLDESNTRKHVVYDNPKGIKLYQIIPVLVKGMQEQQEEIQQLKALVNKLLLEKKK